LRVQFEPRHTRLRLIGITGKNGEILGLRKAKRSKVEIYRRFPRTMSTPGRHHACLLIKPYSTPPSIKLSENEAYFAETVRGRVHKAQFLSVPKVSKRVHFQTLRCSCRCRWLQLCYEAIQPRSTANGKLKGRSPEFIIFQNQMTTGGQWDIKDSRQMIRTNNKVATSQAAFNRLAPRYRGV
jgi:hypothetical protein